MSQIESLQRDWVTSPFGFPNNINWKIVLNHREAYVSVFCIFYIVNSILFFIFGSSMFGNVVVYTKYKPNGTKKGKIKNIFIVHIDIQQGIVLYDMVYVLVKSGNWEATEKKMIETHVTCVSWNVNKSRNFCFHNKTWIQLRAFTGKPF